MTIYITVAFETRKSEFPFPASFEGYLSINDLDISREIQNLIEKKKKEAENNKKEMHKNINNKTSYIKQISPDCQRKGTVSYANIAFKCNYCNGGSSIERIGFNGVCSDDVIRNNVITEHRTWCGSDE